MQLLKSEYYDLPNKYNQTVIRLLVQSPTRMYAYWEVSDETIKYFSKSNSNYDDCTPALKITNLTQNYSYLVPVDPYANNYYIEVEDTGCNYRVELGRYSKNKFVNIYTSNNVTMPIYSRDSANDYNYDDVMFGNYLCIADRKKIKVFADRKYFANQNHTDFENISSDEMYRS